MSTQQWSLANPATGATWTMPINPNAMTSPEPVREMTFTSGVRRRGSLGYTRTLLNRPTSVSWEWSGVIHDEDHYTALENWAKTDGPVHVTDHLGRTYRVLLTEFDPTDRRPTPRAPWRFTYTMRTQILRRVS